MFDPLNVIATLFSIGTLIFSFMIYKRLKYRPLIFIVLQAISGVILRVFIDMGYADRGSIQNNILVTIFYTSMFLATLFLYKTIKKYV